MKPFSFKTHKSAIRVLKEPVIKKKKFNFDRMLYFLIIAVCLVLLIRYTFTKTAIIKGDGQILMSKVDVNFTHDIRLSSFYVQEGDTICENERLFTYIEDQFDNDANGIFSNQNYEQDMEKKRLELLYKIKAQRIKIRALESQMQLLVNEKERMTQLVLLDVYTIDKLQELLSQIEALKTQLALEKSTLALLYEQLRFLKDPSMRQLYVGFGGDGNAVNSTYQAPINGVIGQITVSENETCYRTKNVMTIHNPEDVFIKAYFDLNEIKNVEIGDEVIIQFPDKTKSRGYINKYYVSTYAVPEEFQKTYEPTERNVVVEVRPLNALERNQWAKYHKLNILVKKPRFEWQL